MGRALIRARFEVPAEFVTPPDQRVGQCVLVWSIEGIELLGAMVQPQAIFPRRREVALGKVDERRLHFPFPRHGDLRVLDLRRLEKRHRGSRHPQRPLDIG